jgi:hypothetical protein
VSFKHLSDLYLFSLFSREKKALPQGVVTILILLFCLHFEVQIVQTSNITQLTNVKRCRNSKLVNNGHPSGLFIDGNSVRIEVECKKNLKGQHLLH